MVASMSNVSSKVRTSCSWEQSLAHQCRFSSASIDCGNPTSATEDVERNVPADSHVAAVRCWGSSGQRGVCGSGEGSV